MRSLGLIEVAAQAELLRLRREARRAARKAAVMAASVLFGAFALAMLHLATWLWLAPRCGPVAATLWLAGGDVAAMLALYALTRVPAHDPVAEGALAIRRQSLRALGSGSTIGLVLRLARGNHLAVALGGSLAEVLVRGLVRR